MGALSRLNSLRVRTSNLDKAEEGVLAPAVRPEGVLLTAKPEVGGDEGTGKTGDGDLPRATLDSVPWTASSSSLSAP